MKTLLLSTCLLFIIVVSSAQTSIDTVNTGLARLRFSGQNNFALTPDYIEFSKHGYPPLDTLFHKDQVAKDGTLKVRLPKGTYDVSVTAKDYESLSITDIEVFNNSDKGDFLLFLKYLKDFRQPHDYDSLRKGGMVLFDSYVIDDSTRQPLPDVCIHTEDNVAHSKSDQNGYYHFYVPLPENDSEIKGRDAVYYEKEGYKTELITAFDMWSNQIWGMSVYMKKGSGVNKREVVDGHTHGGRNASVETIESIRKNHEGNLKQPYLSALHFMRDARWMIIHPDSSLQSREEEKAVEEIGEAINEIINDGVVDSNENWPWRPISDGNVPSDHQGKLYQCMVYLYRAREAIAHDKRMFLGQNANERIVQKINDAIATAKIAIK